MKSEIEPLNSAITLPGCELSPNGLRVLRELSDDEFLTVGAALQRMHGAASFWWGDYLTHGFKRHGVQPDRQESWLRDYSQAVGIDAGELLRCAQVATYFPQEVRKRVSFTHHLDAMRGAGEDMQMAWGWVGDAEEAGLTASQFRAKVRKQISTKIEANDPGPPDDGPDREVAAINRWCTQRMRWSAHAKISEAALVLQDMAPVVDFIDRLREKIRGEQK